ncbi:MAG: cytochrome-c peroxidase [Bacteroidia bacterium]
MKNKFLYIIFFVFISAFLFNSFIEENPYFKITEKDVELKIPKGFPKPFYNFKNNKLSPDVFVLGRKLFFDPILSSDSTISCASCHQRIAAFAHFDHPLSHGINGLIGKRNVAGLQNLIWKDSYMWDGGVNNLEVQPVNPITNPVEMNESLVHVVSKLKKNKEYIYLFNKAFKDSTVNSERILKALAQFTGLMISANSLYDKYMAGKDTFSVSELNGLKLFRSQCSNCHKEPLLTDNSYRNNGIKQDTALKDNGRGIITGITKDNNTFKVPGLRNIERTYPYMHDGRFRTLKQVLDHYSNAANYDSGADLSLYKIHLTEKDKSDLIAFLKTLTDNDFLYDRRFVDPNMK